MFGPRGTGIVWGRPDAWKGHQGIIPTFDWAAFKLWMQGKTPESLPPGPRVTPGGFHAFEHRWALAEAFRFHLAIGKPRVTARIHELATRCKQGLAAIGGKVKLRTPMSRRAVVRHHLLRDRRHGARTRSSSSCSRRRSSPARPPTRRRTRASTPGLLNTPEEVDRAVAEVKALAV